MTKKIFLNYRSAEGVREAKSLFHCLLRKFTKRQLFMDLAHLQGGQAWLDAIDAHVAESFVMVALIGPDWLNLEDEQGTLRLSQPNDPVRYEIATALRRKVPVIPVQLDDARLPLEHELPLDMRGMLAWHAMPLRFQSFDEDASKIAVALLRHKPVRKVAHWAVAAGSVGGLTCGVAVGVIGTDRMRPELPMPAALVSYDLGEWERLRGERDAAVKRAEAAESQAKAATQITAELQRKDVEIEHLRRDLHAHNSPVVDAGGDLATPQDSIRRLQRNLHALGYYNGAFDGLPGPRLTSAMRNAYPDQGSADGTSASQDTTKLSELLDRVKRDSEGAPAALAVFVAALIEHRQVPTADPAMRPEYPSLDVLQVDHEVRQSGSFPFDGEQAEIRLNVTGPSFDRFVVLDNGLNVQKVELCKRPCAEVADGSPQKKTITRDEPMYRDSGSKYAFKTEAFVSVAGGGLLPAKAARPGENYPDFADTLYLRLTQLKATPKSFSITLVYRRCSAGGGPLAPAC